MDKLSLLVLFSDANLGEFDRILSEVVDTTTEVLALTISTRFNFDTEMWLRRRVMKKHPKVKIDVRRATDKTIAFLTFFCDNYLKEYVINAKENQI